MSNKNQVKKGEKKLTKEEMKKVSGGRVYTARQVKATVQKTHKYGQGEFLPTRPG
jgi:bacteriocin-like protein